MLRQLFAVSTIAVTLTAGAVTPASAAPHTFGCAWPRVCLYLHSSDWVDRKPTAAYQEVSQDFQMLGPRGRHAYAIYNSRIDDAVWLLNADGTESCLEPNGKWFFNEIDPPDKVVGILIVTDSECLPD